MSHTGVVVNAILVFASAGVVRGNLFWSGYVSFAAAAMGLVATIVQLRRKRTQ